MCKWYLSTSSDEDSTTNEDLSSDDHKTVLKDKTGSSFKFSKAKTRSKILLVPAPIRDCILGLAGVSTYAKILNKEFEIRKPKDDVAASANVVKNGKRKML
ncbi:hypothetical protein Tco_0982079 [Tanacetum coccineum]